MSSSPSHDLVSVAEAARILGITRRAVVHRIHAGTLQAVKLGPGTAAYVIEREELRPLEQSAS